MKPLDDYSDDDPLGGRSVRFHLLGPLDFDTCEALQRRVAEEVEDALDARIVVLLCEHPRLISVGQEGSRAHVRFRAEQLKARGLEVRWVSRRGGCLLHGPGQLAIYVLAALSMHGWTADQFLERMRRGMSALLLGERIASRSIPAAYGLWGRTGQLVSVGVTVRETVSCGAVYLNVNAQMADYRRVDAASPARLPSDLKRTMSCLLAERGRPVKMSKVRAAAVRQLAAVFDCPDYHMFTGHPFLASRKEQTA